MRFRPINESGEMGTPLNFIKTRKTSERRTDLRRDLLTKFKMKPTILIPEILETGNEDDEEEEDVADVLLLLLLISVLISSLSFKIKTSVSIPLIFSMRLATSFLDTCGESSTECCCCCCISSSGGLVGVVVVDDDLMGDVEGEEK